MVRIGFDEASFGALLNLQKTNYSIADYNDQLSSGKRVNSAADDASSLAISERMLMEINGTDQAMRNSLDGISLLQTTEGAMEDIVNLLQRARTLSVQAANETLTQDDRHLIQLEMSQILNEISRISSTAEFNGRSLLNGESGANAIKIDSQSDFQNGTSSQSMGTDEIDSNTTPGSILLATEPYEVDVNHPDPNNEDYIDIYRTAVTAIGGGQYNVKLSVRFRTDGGANNYQGTFILNDANINSVTPFNLGGGDFANQNGNQVDFGIDLTDAEGLAGFDIDFDTTDVSAAFDLDLNNPINQSFNTYFDNTLIQSGVPPYDAVSRFEPLFTSGTYTTQPIDLGENRQISVDVDESKPTGSNITYQIQTSDTGVAGTFGAPTSFTPGTTFTVDKQYVQVVSNFTTPANLSKNGISPQINSITVTPRGNTLFVHDGPDVDQELEINLPDLRLAELRLTDLNVEAKRGDPIYSDSISTQADFESGALNNLTADLHSGRLELATEPFGTEVPGGTVGQERYISVSRSASAANPDGTVTSTIRLVTGSDASNPRDNPGGVVANTNQTRFTGKLRLLDGDSNPLFGALDETTVAPVSLEGYDPGGDAIPPYNHGTTIPGPGNARDDIVNGPGNPSVGGDGNLIDEDGYVQFDISTVGVQDGFDITFTAKPDAQFQLFDVVARDKSGAAKPPNQDVPIDIYFGPQLIGMLDSTGGPQSISQAFEERQIAGTFESALIDMGAGGLNRVSFNSSTPGATGLTVEYQTSSDGIGFTAYQPITDGGTFTSPEDNRYVRFKVTMTGDAGNRYLTPTLDDLSISRITADDGARLAMGKLDSAINTVSEKRSELGAKENRLTARINYLSQSYINHNNSYDFKIDADFSEVISSQMKERIIQQTASAYLAQGINMKREIISKLLQ